MSKPVIVTCAITGSIHTPSMSPHLPVTPEEIAGQAIAAAQAGAAIIHLHARDPQTGMPSSDPELFRQILAMIAKETDAVLNISTGGSSRIESRRTPGGCSPSEARNVLSQYGFDEFRVISHGRATDGMAARMGAQISRGDAQYRVSEYLWGH